MARKPELPGSTPHETPKQAPTISVGAAGEKTIIACKIAVAWFELELCEKEEVYENTQTGPRQITQWKRTGKIFRVHGTAYPTGTVPEGFGPRPEMVNGYAITRNCPRDFWANWSEQHKLAPYVQSSMILADTSMDAIRARTAEHKNQMSGLEPVQRSKSQIIDPRVTKPVMKEVQPLEEGVRG